MQSTGKYSPLLQVIHWTVALLVICQLAMGCLLGQLRSLQYGQSVMGLHRQLGFLVLIISIVRLVAVLRQKPPALGDALPAWQLIAARCVHVGFYVALIAEPIFGLFVAWARGDTVTALGIVSLPAPWDISDGLRDHAMTAHIVMAAALLSLVTVHVGAVLFNQWHRRVPILDRMLPSGPAGTLVNRVPVAAQLLSALGIVVVIALAFGINAVVKYRELTASRLTYQATDQAAADESRTAQVAWKEILGISATGLSTQVTDRLRKLADTALTHLDGAAEQVTDPTARSAITAVTTLVRPLSEGKESFSAAAIADVDTHLQDLIDTQAASAQQRLAEITEGASAGHDLIVVTLAPMVLLGLVLAILLARSMSSSISRMRALVRGVATNEKSGDIIVRGHGELAELMRDMVSMQAAVQQRTQREADERLAVEQSLREGLEVRVLERTAELSQKTADVNAMLNNMNLGVSTVIPGNRIHPEYSNYLRTIFSVDDVAGRDVVDCLFAKSSLGVDAKDQITVALGAILGEEEMMFEFNSHLLAREMHLDAGDGTQKIVKMAWSPIIGEHSTVDKVLLITQDVTQLRDLEKNSAHQQDELDAIAKIIKISIGKFNDFFESTKGFIAANRRLIDETEHGNAEVVAALFRNMHTIKGNARMFEFTRLTDAAHSAEQTYDLLRKDAAAPWVAEDMRGELEAVAAAAAHYVKVSEETLGRKGRASDLFTTRGVFVGNDELAELRSMAAALPEMHAGAVGARLRRTIGQLGLVPLQRLIGGSMDSLASMCAKLGKPAPAVEIMNAEIAFISAFAEALKSSLIHILRNSMDHGIEGPAERILAGKPQQGKVTFACERNGDGVVLRISDDGRGLSLHALHEKGLAGGLYAADDRPTREALADSIFRSGLSTAANVTDISGRGVGLDAVRVFLQEQGASIRVALDESGDTALAGFARFAFVISVPPTALCHAVSAEAGQLVRDVQAESALSDVA
jgi:cytochrome b561/HPt (histidine-containing phosphotransfer) domain-containing protein